MVCSSVPDLHIVLKYPYFLFAAAICTIIFISCNWFLEARKVGKLQSQIDNLEEKIKNDRGRINSSTVQTKPIYLPSVNEQIDKDKGSINNAPTKNI